MSSGFRDRSIGSSYDEFLLGLHDGAGRLHYVGSVDITAAQKNAIRKLTARKTTSFAGRQPGDYSNWNTEPSGPWKPVSPRLVIEVRYDHFSDGRFRLRDDNTVGIALAFLLRGMAAIG